jgi:hypothetical protein
MRSRFLQALCASGWLVFASSLTAETVPVRHAEGVVHGFLLLKALDGTPLADGDLIQFAQGDRVTSRVVFRFKDGSIHDETVVFSQRERFRLVSDKLLQKGPSFPHPVESTVEAASGRVTVRYWDEKGKEEVKEKRMELPDDLANGLMFTLLKNIRPEVARTTFSMVAVSGSPRLVKVVHLVIAPAGTDSFSVGRTSYKATRYLVKIEIGGLAGVLAPLVGKKPVDTTVWVLEGEAPTFVRSEGQLFFGGPVWRVELASPSWPRTAAPPAEK